MLIILKFFVITESSFSFTSLSFLVLSSQFEEKFEEMNSAEPPVSFPTDYSSGFNENQVREMVPVESSGNEVEPQAQQAHQRCSDLNSSQDFVGGMMKIVPSDVDVSAVTVSNPYSFIVKKYLIYMSNIQFV